MGQISDPYDSSQDDLGITISGLPGELDEPDPPEDGARGSASAGGDVDDGELIYELDEWSELERDAVADRLREAGVPHRWDGAALHVAAVDEAITENVLDAIDGEDNSLDPGQDQVAYDLYDWDDDRISTLVDALDEAGIASSWDGDELFVYAADEQAVDELLDGVAHPHELAAEPDDGGAGGELLGEVFLAADRLQHDAEDHEGTVMMLDLAQLVQKAPSPYGLRNREWDALRAQVVALADLLRSAAVDADAVLTAAGDLRTAIRPYV